MNRRPPSVRPRPPPPPRLPEDGDEDPDYLSKQLITYLGNKRALLGHLAAGVEKVRRRLGGRRLHALDAFSGTGVVSRMLKKHCDRLVSNDLEDYAEAAGRCYLANRGEVDGADLADLVRDLDSRADAEPLPTGFIEEMYAPKDDERIAAGDRAFYTRGNARRLDNLRRMLDAVAAPQRALLLGPLLAAASVHANTAGVFKGFYRDRATALGRFGGTNADALARITKPIRLAVPTLSRFECDAVVLKGDAAAAADAARGLDLAYLDPPYNQHPYGSNYFMLNLLCGYRRPAAVSRNSGIPTDWLRSAYNSRRRAFAELQALVAKLDAPFVMLSFNNEGFVPPAELRAFLAGLGRCETLEIPYNAYRGSRNLAGRSLHVVEQLFLLERR